MEEWTYAVVYYMLVSSVVIDVDCHAAEGGDFGGEFGEAGVVLSVGLGVRLCEEGSAWRDILLAVV